MTARPTPNATGAATATTRCRPANRPWTSPCAPSRVVPADRVRSLRQGAADLRDILGPWRVADPRHHRADASRRLRRSRGQGGAADRHRGRRAAGRCAELCCGTDAPGAFLSVPRGQCAGIERIERADIRCVLWPAGWPAFCITTGPRSASRGRARQPRPGTRFAGSGLRRQRPGMQTAQLGGGLRFGDDEHSASMGMEGSDRQAPSCGCTANQPLRLIGGTGQRPGCGCCFLAAANSLFRGEFLYGCWPEPR